MRKSGRRTSRTPSTSTTTFKMDRSQPCPLSNPVGLLTVTLRLRSWTCSRDSLRRSSTLCRTIKSYGPTQPYSLPSTKVVAIGIPVSGFVDGHPASSKLDLFEGFVKKIVDLVQDNKKLWADTAIFITFDEGGGYWDSG